MLARFESAESHVDRVVFVDRDGVINRHMPGSYVLSIEQFQWLPGVRESLLRLTDAGVSIVVVSNQSCVGRGLLSAHDLEAIMATMMDGFLAAGVRCLGWICCPHTPEDGCLCRKPGSAMFERIAQSYALDLTKCAMFGDSESDVEAARRAGVPPVLLERDAPADLDRAVTAFLGAAGRRARVQRTVQSLGANRKAHLVRAKAPLRISFCGGGTDVSPYPERFGGCVLSCTIDKYAYVSVRARDDDRIAIQSLDYGISVNYDPSALDSSDGKLRLVEAIVRRFGARGVDIFMHSDAPPGSGLGSSSTMIVALCAALARFDGHELTRYDLAELAYSIEREDLAITGGMQDQYAAAFGGFNYIEFNAQSVVVNPLRLSDETLNELHYHLMLCYTGGTRESSNIVAEQTKHVEDNDSETLGSLHRMKALTADLKSYLLRNELRSLGAALHEAWSCKRKLATSISNTRIDEFYETARRAGAWGGKILGAGGGGYLLVAVPFRRRTEIAHALEQIGGKMTEFQFDGGGVRTWIADEDTWSTD